MIGRNLKFGLQKGLVLLFVGLVVGVLAGWISLITTEGADALAASAARFYPLFGLALVVALFLLVNFDLKGNDWHYYQPLGAALIILITAAMSGFIGGTIFFIGAAAQIPAVFGQESAADIVSALYPAIGFESFLLVLLISLLAAVVISFFAHRRLRNDPRAKGEYQNR